MLYVTDGSTRPADGEIVGDREEQLAQGPVLGSQYLLGGVPGATDIPLPDNVGLRLPSSPNLMFSLQVHYLNSSDQVQLDDSGVEICVTSKKRPIEAAAHWLGTTALDLPAHRQTDVSMTCEPTPMAEPAHIMAITPHMHRKGTHSKAVLTRRTGEQVTLIDKPYEFVEQRLYRMPEDRSAQELLLHPGDTLSMTCSFQNDSARTVGYGESSDDEMCYLTVWAWPAGSIHNLSPLGYVLGVPQDQVCLVP